MPLAPCKYIPTPPLDLKLWFCLFWQRSLQSICAAQGTGSWENWSQPLLLRQEPFPNHISWCQCVDSCPERRWGSEVAVWVSGEKNLNMSIPLSSLLAIQLLVETQTMMLGFSYFVGSLITVNHNEWVGLDIGFVWWSFNHLWWRFTGYHIGTMLKTRTFDLIGLTQCNNKYYFLQEMGPSHIYLWLC